MFVHPEIKENEVFIMNMTEKEFKDLSVKLPSFVVSVRQGNVAYSTDGRYKVPADTKYHPVFAILRSKYKSK